MASYEAGLSTDAQSLGNARLLIAALFDSAPMPIAVFSVSGVHDIVNANAAACYGMTIEQMLAADRQTLENFWPHFQIDVQPAIEEVIRTKTTRVITTVFQPPQNAATIHFEVTFFPILDEGGNVKQIGNFARDLTEQMRVEAELETRRGELHQAEKLASFGSLLAGVSHELNNPLAAVIGQAAMLAEDVADTEHLARVEKIQRAAERCAKIVQSFLAMARQQMPEYEAVQLNDLVRAALDLTDFQMKFTHVRIETDLDSSLPRIEADPDQLHQVIVNLLNNACQAVELQPTNRKIKITSTTEGSQVRLTVADTGGGIPLDIRQRIFDPFFTTKPSGSGTGLGLSFSLGIAEAHGGTIRLDDVLEGTSFSIFLPVGGRHVVQSALVPKYTATSEASGTVLVIDDEEEVADTLADMLKRMGLVVSVAVGGKAAIEHLSCGAQFDLILSDVRMPEIDGPALYAWIALERPDLVDRLTFVTGDTLSGTASDFLAECGRPFLEKPFLQSDLQRLVATIIDI